MGPGAIKERFRRVPTEVAEERGRTKAAFEEIVTLAPRFLESTRWINYTSATLSSLLVERADRGFALPLVQRAIEAFHLGSGEPLKVSASISKEPYSPREEIRIGKGTRDPFSKPKVKIEFNGSSFNLVTYFQGNWLTFFGLQFLAAAILNMLASGIAMRRYLKV